MNREPLWKRCLPLWLHSWVRWAFIATVLLVLALAGTALFYHHLARGYDISQVAELPPGAVFHDRDGREILLPGTGARRPLTRAEIPDFLVECLLAREDARFYHHPGIDLRGILRATARNIRDRRYTQGASTISMQLTRNSYENMRGKTLHRKLLEIALTLRVEARYPKDEILAHYLNRIYFGAGAYGLEQAALTYFGRPASELNDGECALIVGIIRGPHVFSPFRNYEPAIRQRNQTLARMLENGALDPAGHQAVLDDPIRLLDESRRESQSSFAMRAVRRELDRIIDREIEPPAGAIHVHTTLDSNWQARLERDIARAVAAIENEPGWPHPTHAGHDGGPHTGYLQYAAITLESRTGQTMAWIGGRDISHSGVDRTRARRDIGTTFEPWIAAAAAERDRLVFPGRAMHTGRQIGPAEVARIASRCGITGPFAEDEDLFRGWVASTPVEIATALATLANEGEKPRPYLIREIRDAKGNTLYHGEPYHSRAIGPQAAAEALRVFRSDSGTRTFTGFTGSARDAWILRIGPAGSTVVWIGFDQPEAIAPAPRLEKLLQDITTRLGN